MIFQALLHRSRASDSRIMRWVLVSCPMNTCCTKQSRVSITTTMWEGVHWPNISGTAVFACSMQHRASRQTTLVPDSLEAARSPEL